MKTLILVAAIAALPFATPALAGTPLQESRIVSTAGLNLSDPAHVATLDRRIANAAREVCHSRASAFDLGAQLARVECRAKARASATPARDNAIAAAGTPVDIRTASR
jgi:UrcA family protein